MPCRSLSRAALFSPISYSKNVARRKVDFSLQLRHYAPARRPSPQFDSGGGFGGGGGGGGGRASNAEEVFKDLRKKYPTAPRARIDDDPSARRGLRRFGLTPWRITLLSTAACVGFAFYNFQGTWRERHVVMNGKFFTPFLLESKDQVSSTSSIFNLRSIPAGGIASNIEEAWKLGVWSVQALMPDLQAARSYTPLPPHDDMTPEQLRLVIRQVPEGVVSTYLHRQPPADVIQIRGPHPEYVLPDDVDEVLFLAGGTGIAPALQVAHCLYNIRDLPADRKPKIHVLWANRRREDSFAGYNPSLTESFRKSILAKIQAGWDFNQPASYNNELEKSQGSTEQSPLVKEIELMTSKHGDRFHVDYFVDEEKTFITEDILRRCLSSEFPAGARETTSSTPGKKLILVSGPDGFVNAYAGPRGWLKGKQTQGPVGGVLEKIGYGDWDVWKL